jgi:predicted nucleotidyltransferase component of viral defense system
MAEVPSRRYFDDRAAETGFLANNLEKAYRITQVLGEISSFDAEGYLALRGGTAINFCYQDVPRLSIDLDEVYIKSFEKGAMERDRAKIRDGLDRIFGFLRYSVELRTTYALDQYLIMYRNRAGNVDRVKVEVNYLSSRVPILKVASRKITGLFDAVEREVVLLAPEELYGSKIKALIERVTARDLYDIYRITQNTVPMDFETLRCAAIFYCCLELVSDFRGRIVSELLSGLDERTIRRELRPLLRRNAAFPLKEAKEAVSALISDIFALDGSEKEFVEAFYGQDYRPDILFPSNPALKYHPRAEWRLKMLAKCKG